MLIVTRKGYTRGPWTDRYGHVHQGKFIPSVTYKIKDVGAPGRGRKTLPPIKRPGAMTAVANDMGYALVTEVPLSKIPEFVDLLVARYGQHSAQGMIIWQYNIRENTPGYARDWFRYALQALSEQYAGSGWEGSPRRIVHRKGYKRGKTYIPPTTYEI